MNDDGSSRKGHSTPVRATAGVAGAGVGLVVAAVLRSPELGAAVAGMAPAMTEEGLARLKRISQGWIDRINHACTFVLRQTGWTEEEFTNAYLSDEQSFNMATQFLRAAANSEDEEWIRSLSCAFIRGLLATDEADKEKYQRVMSTLSSLEPIDARTLGEMHNGGQSNWGWHKRRLDDKPNRNVLTEALPQIVDTIDSIVARLSTMGLITDGSGDSVGMSFGSAWNVTSFGKLCVDAMRTIGEDERLRMQK